VSPASVWTNNKLNKMMKKKERSLDFLSDDICS
jgi:hypothetical protein